jgi:hypothetical protein
MIHRVGAKRRPMAGSGNAGLTDRGDETRKVASLSRAPLALRALAGQHLAGLIEDRARAHFCRRDGRAHSSVGRAADS